MTLPANPSHSGVIAYRRSSTQVHVLLITSRASGRWVIPKGRIEPDLTSLESAKKEAYEEAGIRGRVRPVPAGQYDHYKQNGTRRVEVFLMEVTEELPDWPEAAERTRCWMPLATALESVREMGLKQLLREALPSE